jgi:hypothetical protein
MAHPHRLPALRYGLFRAVLRFAIHHTRTPELTATILHESAPLDIVLKAG